MRYEVARTGTVTNVNGTYTLTCPSDTLNVFIVDQISIRLSVSAGIVTAESFKNSATQTNFISSTRTGEADTDSIPNIELYPGESIVVVWKNAIDGSIATISLRGEI
jgi:hypothetical protein